jgi:Protein of unknown function (DUF669)
MFDYDPMTEQEAQEARFDLLPDGEYDALIENSIDKVSANSGNPMMDMTLLVFDKNGKGHPVRDFAVFTKSMMWKVIHLAESAGLEKEYLEKKFCSAIVRNRSVRVKVSMQKGDEIPVDKLKGKPPGSRYPDKNRIDDYLKKGATPKPVKVEEPFLDDDIDVPF